MLLREDTNVLQPALGIRGKIEQHQNGNAPGCGPLNDPLEWLALDQGPLKNVGSCPSWTPEDERFVKIQWKNMLGQLKRTPEAGQRRKKLAASALAIGAYDPGFSWAHSWEDKCGGAGGWWRDDTLIGISTTTMEKWILDRLAEWVTCILQMESLTADLKEKNNAYYETIEAPEPMKRNRQ